MKSILEQNFDELYAQIEERVKCIQPIKQVDTFTKTMMWTSLNEILMDIFGDSRFMWMIETNDGGFTVMFVDKYKIISTRNLTVKHTDILKWPTEAELNKMSYDEIVEFKRSCLGHGVTITDICQRYGKTDSWFHVTMTSRKNGSLSRDSDAFRLKMSKRIASSWTDEELNNHLFVYELIKRQIPLSRNILTQMLGDEKTVRRAIAASLYGSCDQHKSWLSYRDDRYLMILDNMIRYLESAIIDINTNPKAFRSQKTIKLSATTSKERRKQLIEMFENMKHKIEIEKETIQQTTTLNQ